MHRTLRLLAVLVASHAPVALAQPQPLPLVQVAAGLASPIDITHAGDGSGRLFIAQRDGIVRILRDGALAASPFIDLRAVVIAGDERGLLGIAFHPRFASTRLFYVNYTRKPDGASVIARYLVPPETPDRADPGSASVLLVIDQPYANHNGGGLRFGPDGLLYIGMGDGGAGNDPQNRAQDPGSLLGKMLRIDVDAGAPYAIPPGNPYANGGGRPEIWAVGLRNPWRYAFDPRNGDLWIGDVGQDAFEEIDVVASGAPPPNFGWRVLEGDRCTGLGGGAPCASSGYTAPVVSYPHDEGCSVTGGEVNLGSALPEVRGAYLFADFCNGKLWAAVGSHAEGYTRRFIGTAGFQVSTFGRDEAGEIYLADFGGGRILRLGSAPAGTVPVVEYHHAGLDHYFITSDPAEIAGLDSGAIAGWRRTGEGFRAFASAVAGSVPICRFWLPPGFGSSHFFSANPDECAIAQAVYPQFVLESPAAMQLASPDRATGACPSGTLPVYRIWNRRPDTNHRYTLSPDTRDRMVAAGGVAEGYGPGAVAMCSPG
ncbi:MAG: hypothetical protein DYH14_04685 [Betaproteobacteria bacterium PRO3]|nr:hypothetical protein [Betaproteobacteria bacterium PRO3]